MNVNSGVAGGGGTLDGFYGPSTAFGLGKTGKFFGLDEDKLQPSPTQKVEMIDTPKTATDIDTLLVDITDTYHDFGHNFRGTKVSAYSGGVSTVRDAIAAAWCKSYKDQPCTSLDAFVSAHSKGIISLTNIEDTTRNYYEQQYPELGTIDTASVYSLSSVLAPSVAEAIADKTAIKVLFDDAYFSGNRNDLFERNKIALDRVKRFFFPDNADKLMYLTFDSSRGKLAKLCEGQMGVRALITPQNVSDSANTSTARLGIISNYYYFPHMKDGAYVSSRNTYSRDRYSLELVPLSSSYSEATYNQFIHRLQKRDLSEKIDMIYGGKVTQGPSVNYLMDCIIEAGRGQTAAFRNVKTSKAAFPNIASLITPDGTIHQDLIQNAGDVFFDIKRAGDQDQAEAARIADGDLENVILATGDRNLALYASIIGVSCIFHTSKYMAMYKKRETSPEMIAVRRYSNFLTNIENILSRYGGDKLYSVLKGKVLSTRFRELLDKLKSMQVQETSPFNAFIKDVISTRFRYIESKLTAILAAVSTFESAVGAKLEDLYSAIGGVDLTTKLTEARRLGEDFNKAIGVVQVKPALLDKIRANVIRLEDVIKAENFIEANMLLFLLNDLEKKSISREFLDDLVKGSPTLLEDYFNYNPNKFAKNLLNALTSLDREVNSLYNPATKKYNLSISYQKYDPLTYPSYNKVVDLLLDFTEDIPVRDGGKTAIEMFEDFITEDIQDSSDIIEALNSFDRVKRLAVQVQIQWNDMKLKPSSNPRYAEKLSALQKHLGELIAQLEEIEKQLTRFAGKRPIDYNSQITSILNAVRNKLFSIKDKQKAGARRRTLKKRRVMRGGAKMVLDIYGDYNKFVEICGALSQDVTRSLVSSSIQIRNVSALQQLLYEYAVTGLDSPSAANIRTQCEDLIDVAEIANLATITGVQELITKYSVVITYDSIIGLLSSDNTIYIAYNDAKNAWNDYINEMELAPIQEVVAIQKILGNADPLTAILALNIFYDMIKGIVPDFSLLTPLIEMGSRSIRVDTQNWIKMLSALGAIYDGLNNPAQRSVRLVRGLYSGGRRRTVRKGKKTRVTHRRSFMRAVTT